MTKIESIRKRLGWSRSVLANAAKVSEQTIYLHETGRAKGICRVLVRESIADALDVKPETLFDRNGVAR